MTIKLHIRKIWEYFTEEICRFANGLSSCEEHTLVLWGIFAVYTIKITEKFNKKLKSSKAFSTWNYKNYFSFRNVYKVRKWKSDKYSCGIRKNHSPYGVQIHQGVVYLKFAIYNVVNFEQISHIALPFLLLTLSTKMPTG